MTTNDKEMAKAWADAITKHGRMDQAAARYILSTLADDRDARIEALKDQLRAEEDEHRKTLKMAERLTKERDEARQRIELLESRLRVLGPAPQKPAAEDAELDAAIERMERQHRIEEVVVLLAARVKEMRRG